MTEKENILGKNILLIGGGSGMGKVSAIALSQLVQKLLLQAGKRIILIRPSSNQSYLKTS